MSRIISGRYAELFDALEKAGFADNLTRRVVIDIEVNSVVKVYVEKYADTRMINVITTLDGIQVTSLEKEPKAEFRNEQ